MKKIQLMILSIIMILILVSCGKEEIDPLSQDTMDKIDSIGEVTLEDQELIENLMETYSQMTDNQKDQVKNYLTLKNDKEELDKILEKKADEDMAKSEEEKAKKYEKQREYYQFIQEAVSRAKEEMKHPTSFVVNGIIIRSETGEENPLVYISYEAENDLGNSISNVTIYVNNTGRGSFFDEEDFNNNIIGTYTEYEQICNSNGDSSHTKKEDNSFTFTDAKSKDVYVFKLDVEDYKAQGYLGIN